jgi:dihydroorotase
MNRPTLIRQATVWQNGIASPYRMDIRIEEGIITQLGEQGEAEGADVIEADDLHVSAGWVDLLANLREPGLEHKEGLKSGLDAAMAGGFTQVLISPEVSPAIDSKAGVEYLLQRSKDHTVKALVVGALTKRLEGKELAEMYDMHLSGASAFHNGKRPISDARLMALSMRYVQDIGSRLFSFPLDVRMAQGGVANEGFEATRLGLRPVPALAEELVVMRDLALAEYLGVPIHIMCISAPGSVAAIRSAKEKGLDVTASVPAHHLYLTDAWLKGFDPNLRVMPPLRSTAQVQLLRNAVADGTIDCIVSDHEPHDIEAKQVEFNQAEPGMATLETAFSAALMGMGPDRLRSVISALTIGPRKVLGLAVPEIKEGARAELTVFSPTLLWTPERTNLITRGRNCPLAGKEIMGKALRIIAN